MILWCVLLFIQSNQGIIIVDNVWFYEGELKSRVINTGTLVDVIDYVDDRIKIKIDDVVGELSSGVLIDFNEEVAQDRLFIFARGYYDQAEYDKAILLFEAFIDNFPWSEYRAEALYYYGMAKEELVVRVVRPDTLSGFLFNERYNIWYYSGEAYIDILEDFSESAYAPKAAYRLLHIFRMSNLPWRDSVELITEELTMWQEFVTKYKTSDEYSVAMLELGYLYRVLYEITEDADYRRRATEIFQKVIDQYPDSNFSAQARVHLFELAKGQNIYKY
jgi:outer membrane protein assembly factor BamD (BamD/ComL family)